MTVSDEVLRTRLASAAAAWLLAGFAVLVLAAALVLLGLYAGAGRLIASRLPGNTVGWLLCLTGLSLAATMLTEQYALYGLATAPGSAGRHDR